MRVHHCPECGYVGSRDVVSAEVIRNRGLTQARSDRATYLVIVIPISFRSATVSVASSVVRPSRSLV
ncbi:MAG: hypothetical protein ACLFTJ_12460, partial [Halothece sp.]